MVLGEQVDLLACRYGISVLSDGVGGVRYTYGKHRVLRAGFCKSLYNII